MSMDKSRLPALDFPTHPRLREWVSPALALDVEIVERCVESAKAGGAPHSGFSADVEERRLGSCGSGEVSGQLVPEPVLHGSAAEPRRREGAGAMRGRKEEGVEGNDVDRVEGAVPEGGGMRAGSDQSTGFVCRGRPSEEALTFWNAVRDTQAGRAGVGMVGDPGHAERAPVAEDRGEFARAADTASALEPLVRDHVSRVSRCGNPGSHEREHDSEREPEPQGDGLHHHPPRIAYLYLRDADGPPALPALR